MVVLFPLLQAKMMVFLSRMVLKMMMMMKGKPHWDWNALFIEQLREAVGRPTKYLSQLLHLYNLYVTHSLHTFPICMYVHLPG